MRKSLFLFICLLLSQAGSAKFGSSYTKLKILGKTFNCIALPNLQKEDLTVYNCSLPPNDPDLTSISIRSFWVTKHDIFEPNKFLEELITETWNEKEGWASMVTCTKPNPKIAIGSGYVRQHEAYDTMEQVLLRVTPNTVIVLYNTNLQKDLLTPKALETLCK